MDGFISYPRTDNTVYPKSLPVRELVQSLVRVKEFSAASGLLDGELKATRGKKETTDHPPIYPTQAIHPGRPRRLQETGLRTRRPPLPRDLQPADDHRVHARRHRGRFGDLLRPRLGRRRPRLRGDLHLRTLRRRGDPGARRGPGTWDRGRALDRRQGDPAAVADLAGETDRDDGGARPRHQSHARRHHPEALRPRLRLRQPAGPLGDRDGALRGVQDLRAANGDAGDDRPGRGRDGPHRRR